jgi:glutaredoxin-related protein
MKTYILNLPSALERRNFQAQQAERLGLDDLFTDAKTPADIPDAFFQAHAFSWERPIKITEVACFMSHHQVWQQIAASHEPALVLEDDAIRQGIKDYSQWPTVPQLYIKGEFVGGSDIMMEMYENGELQQILNAPSA